VAVSSSPAVWQEDRYRSIFQNAAQSEVLRSIWLGVYGDDYPLEAEPFGFITLSDLEIIASLIKQPAAQLVDIGCGKGGPGLWVARKIGSSLIGLDLLAEAIVQANLFRDRFANCPPAEFRVASFNNTRLPSASASVVLSIDSFWMVLDKVAALREMARILRPSGQFIMATWTPAYVDLPQLMKTTGFEITGLNEPKLWRERQLLVYEGIQANAQQLRAEVGIEAAEILLAEAVSAPDSLSKNARKVIVAERC
jgi:SAM-dependent methyltransferase